MRYTGIYEQHIKRIAITLTSDEHLRKDVEQEMRLYLIKSKHNEDSQIQPTVMWMAKNRAIDYLRKFIKGQIPFGSMEDIDNLINVDEDIDF